MSAETTTQDTVRDLLATALGTPIGPQENPRREDREDWNSLIHIELVFMLEERFDVRFSDAEIAQLSSPSQIVALIEAKHAG